MKKSVIFLSVLLLAPSAPAFSSPESPSEAEAFAATLELRLLLLDISELSTSGMKSTADNEKQIDDAQKKDDESATASEQDYSEKERLSRESEKNLDAVLNSWKSCSDTLAAATTELWIMRIVAVGLGGALLTKCLGFW